MVCSFVSEVFVIHKNTVVSSVSVIRSWKYNQGLAFVLGKAHLTARRISRPQRRRGAPTRGSARSAGYADAKRPRNGTRFSRRERAQRAERSAGVTVGGAVARPTADSEPDVRVSPHPAPRSVGPCQWYSPACAWS